MGCAFVAGCGSVPTARLAAVHAAPAAHSAVPAASATLAEEGPTVALEPAVSLVAPLAPDAIRQLVGDAEQADDAGDGSRQLRATAIGTAAFQTWKGLLSAARTGQRTLLPGHLPDYPGLPADALAAAQTRGDGHRVPQACIKDSPNGTRLFEPVTLVVHGARADVEAVLSGRGWVQANPRSTWSYIKMGGSVVTRLWNERSSPVSAMYLDGKPEVFAMNKNGDYVLARDHMRVYPAPAELATDGVTWQIAASRDLAATVTIHHPTRGESSWRPKFRAPSFGHETDRDTDGERDLIMADLLASGRVTDWRAEAGQLPDAPGVKVAPDGSATVGSYHTDGRVYEVWIGATSR